MFCSRHLPDYVTPLDTTMKSLASKMTLTVSLVVAALLCLIIVISHLFWTAELKKSIGANQNTMVRTLASQVDIQLQTALAQLDKIAQRIGEGDLTDVQRLDRIFTSEEDARIFFNAGLELLSPAGRIVMEYPLDPKDVGQDFSRLEHFKQAVAQRKPFIGTTYSNHNDSQATIPFTVPLLDKAGTLRGVLVGRHELAKGTTFSSLVGTRIGKSGYFYIIDTDRHIVAHPETSRLMEHIRTGINPAIEAALGGFEGTMENVNSGGVRGLTSFKRLASTNWILGIHHPLQEAYQPLRRSLVISIGLLCLTLLLCILITRSSVARMLEPLNRLTQTIHTFQPGQARVGAQQALTTDDEVGRLGAAYELMIDKIEEQHAALQHSALFVENLVMHSSAPIFVLDRNHRILFWNLALAKMTGLASEEMKGTDRHWEPFYSEKRPTLADLVLDHAEKNIPEYYSRFQKSRLIDGAMQSEGWFSFPGMGKRYLYFHASPIHAADGTTVAVVETLEDMTETKQIEEMLNEQFRFLQQVLDSIPNPIFYKNRNSAYIGCNRAFEQFFDRSRTEIMGKKITDLMPGELARFQAEQDRACMKNGSTLTYETELVRADGTLRQVIATKAPMHDRNGKISGLVGTYTDISERKLIETALRESEEKFRAISDSAQDGIILIDNNGKVTFWNAAAETIFGFTRDEIMGKDLHECIAPPAMEARFREAFTSFRDSGTGAAIGKSLEMQAIRKDGTDIPIEMSLSAVRLNDTWCAIGLTRDITTRKAAQEAVVASQAALEAKHAELGLVFNWVESAKQEWEQTLDSLKDIIILADAEHRIRRCNRMLLDITGKDFGALVQQDWREVLSDTGFSFVTFDGHSGELLHEKSRHQFDLNIYEIHASESETPQGLVVSLNDVTELKEMTRELEQAYAELQSTQTRVVQQEKMASIGQMAAGVAHEINNPMGFITSNLNTLGKYSGRIDEYVAALHQSLQGCEGHAGCDELDGLRRKLKVDYIISDMGELISESMEGAERVRKIVQDLKSFSRVDEADEKFADINQCLDSTINIVWNEIKYVATLHKEYGEIPQVKCYPQQLNQVFVNLLVNAAHAMSGQGEITVRTWNDEANVFVAVSDTGSGIPEEIQKRIFEPFFTTKEAGKGTGLGLSISYDIIRKHGGELALESRVGEGTTFTVRLPVDRTATA